MERIPLECPEDEDDVRDELEAEDDHEREVHVREGERLPDARGRGEPETGESRFSFRKLQKGFFPNMNKMLTF